MNVFNLKGTCICKAGFASSDCSINILTAPILSKNSFPNGTCDVQKTNCYEVILNGAGFSVDNDQVSLLVNSSILTKVIFFLCFKLKNQV